MQKTRGKVKIKFKVKSQIRNPKSKILIVGAGPAGASAAIRLAQKGFRVTIAEREKFPRPKLCGEFISPECLEHFRALGAYKSLTAAGGQWISETIFYEPGGKSVAVPSRWFHHGAAGALSLSRAEMDFQLLERARAVGVEVLEEVQAVGLLMENETVVGVKIRGKNGETKEIFAGLTIDATGRSRILTKLAEREFQREDAKPPRRSGKNRNPELGTWNFQTPKTENRKSKLVGFKAHLKNAAVEPGVCEIYSFRGGYGGLCRVENGLANHCFLIQAEIVKKFGGDAERIVRETVWQNARAAETLKNAASGDSGWLAVAVDGFGARDLNPARNLFAVGDAGAFIDPFTGSGMLMALESGAILARSITENFASPAKIAAVYRARHAENFRRRLFVCSLVRRAAFAPGLAKTLISALNWSESARALLARATRRGSSTTAAAAAAEKRENFL
jgi:menaquinone-9 beta-reductase